MSRQLYGYEGERFVAYFWCVGWWALSLGVHIDVRSPNVEFHLPFGFFRIGMRPKPRPALDTTPSTTRPEGLSTWSGWDKSRWPWSESKHKDAVCEALFRAPWSVEDAAALIGFIDRTWTTTTVSSMDGGE